MNGQEEVPAGSVRVAALDPAFAVRGHFWQPGHNVTVEPWTVLIETSVGQKIIPCGRDAARARTLVAILAGTERVPGADTVLGVVVIAPDGTPSHGWAATDGAVPVPGAPLWSRLARLAHADRCPRCESTRWPGCWVGQAGCGACGPDNRPGWPADPPAPVGQVDQRRAAKRAGAGKATVNPAPGSDTPDPDRLF